MAAGVDPPPPRPPEGGFLSLQCSLSCLSSPSVTFKPTLSLFSPSKTVLSLGLPQVFSPVKFIPQADGFATSNHSCCSPITVVNPNPTTSISLEVTSRVEGEIPKSPAPFAVLVHGTSGFPKTAYSSLSNSSTLLLLKQLHWCALQKGEASKPFTWSNMVTPTVSFLSRDIAKLLAYKLFVIIGKFPHGPPSMVAIKVYFNKLKISGVLSLLDYKPIIIGCISLYCQACSLIGHNSESCMLPAAVQVFEVKPQPSVSVQFKAALLSQEGKLSRQGSVRKDGTHQLRGAARLQGSVLAATEVRVTVFSAAVGSSTRGYFADAGVLSSFHRGVQRKEKATKVVCSQQGSVVNTLSLSDIEQTVKVADADPRHPAPQVAVQPTVFNTIVKDAHQEVARAGIYAAKELAGVVWTWKSAMMMAYAIDLSEVMCIQKADTEVNVLGVHLLNGSAVDHKDIKGDFPNVPLQGIEATSRSANSVAPVKGYQIKTLFEGVSKQSKFIIKLPRSRTGTCQKVLQVAKVVCREVTTKQGIDTLDKQKQFEKKRIFNMFKSFVSKLSLIEEEGTEEVEQVRSAQKDKLGGYPSRIGQTRPRRNRGRNRDLVTPDSPRYRGPGHF